MYRAVLLVLAVAAAGCDQRHSDQSTATPANNTKTNERDREPGALTPTDQKENETDRTITQEVRKGVMSDDTLSTSTKNVKIITRDGVVTLRGPVPSDKEKAAVVEIAGRTGNVKRVDDQLQIASN